MGSLLKAIFPLQAAVLFCLWWGGLVFYAAVVVPIGGQIHGVTEQGAVTASVSVGLNVLGSFTAANLGMLLFFPQLTGRGRREPFPLVEPVGDWQSRRIKLAVWWVTVSLQLGLWILGWVLFGLFDSNSLKIDYPDRFYFYHRLYLWLTMGQMAVGLWWLALVMRTFPIDHPRMKSKQI